MVRVTREDELLQAAIVDQLNAELGAAGISVKEMAKKLGRPYDSTRNYLRKERTIPFLLVLECAKELGIPTETIIARARQRLV